MKTSHLILGVVGGLAAGAILGVLFAPDTGKNTRKKIKDKTSNLKGDLKDGFDTFLQDVEEKYQSVTDSAKEMFEDGKAKIRKEV